MKGINYVLVGLCCLLVGCTAMTDMGYPLLPEEPTVKILHNPKAIAYVLPPELGINDIKFESYNKKVASKTYQSLSWSLNRNKLRVELRTHNGVAGSGVVYNIDVLTESPYQVVFIPKDVSTYQEGIFFPYPVPQFDINNFLATTFYQYEFEVNSEYQPSSIEGNFIRMLDRSKNKKHQYKFNLDDASVFIYAKFYPYRDGTKVVIKANIQTQLSDKSPIVLEEICKEIDRKVVSIVNA